ncbi:hypothetical protein Dip510_000609 [Elusimicrobium posterum]|uniref:hypothetical protein n=1 Tax=Elusimicrobium posterum TaxID=3116653 RepID=UPI003C75E50C
MTEENNSQMQNAESAQVQTPLQQDTSAPASAEDTFAFPLKLALTLFLLAFPVTFYVLWKMFFTPDSGGTKYILATYLLISAVVLTVFSGKFMRFFVAGTFLLVFLGLLFGETIFYAVALVPLFFIVIKVLTGKNK